MRENRSNLSYISHIRDSIKNITAYTSLHDYEHFSENGWDQAAIIRYFEVMGEAASRLDSEFKHKYQTIEWRDIVDFRNFLIHDYIDVDIQVVWKIMTRDIPMLEKKIDSIRDEE